MTRVGAAGAATTRAQALLDGALAAAAAGAGLLALHAAVNARLLRRPALTRSVGNPGPPQGSPTDRRERVRVSALVPARNEADRIAPCVRTLLASRGVDLEVLVLDDRSTDGTRHVAEDAGGGDPRLRVLAGAPLPEGWLGKPHACAQLANEASGEVLVFVDADVRVRPDGIAATVALLDEGPLDLVCPYPRQEADGPGPRLVQPLLQWSWLTFVPLRLAERAPRPSLVVANGQLAACTTAAYRRAGGHAAVAAAVIEDLELGRAFARAGLRAGVADGTQVASCRMYTGWEELREGYAKSLWAAFGSGPGALAALSLLSWFYVLPAAAALAGRGRTRLLGLAGYAGGVAGRALAARRTGGRPGDAVAHPVSVGVLAWLTAVSFRRRAQGRLVWRGRHLPSGKAA